MSLGIGLTPLLLCVATLQGNSGHHYDATGCSIHLPGSYPHDQWQGSRIEGFVISQGQAISQDYQQQLQQLQQLMKAKVCSMLQTAG